MYCLEQQADEFLVKTMLQSLCYKLIGNGIVAVWLQYCQIIKVLVLTNTAGYLETLGKVLYQFEVYFIKPCTVRLHESNIRLAWFAV